MVQVVICFQNYIFDLLITTDLPVMAS